MPGYTLRTLGGLTLEGPNGPLVIGDPIALGSLCLTVLAPGGSIDENDALLRLTPELTAPEGRARLARAVAAVTAAAGAPLLELANGRLTADLTRLACDVEMGTGGGRAVADRFLAGVAQPDSPEFREWVAAVRPAIRVRSPRAAPGRGRRVGLVTGLAAVVVLALALVTTRAPREPDVVPGEAIVLADLDNATGDTLFDRSLITAAAIGLRQSPQMSLLSPGRVRAALGRMGLGRPDTVPLTFDRAREVAARENVRHAVGFRLEPAGAGYRLSVQVVNSETGKLVIGAEAAAETKAGTIGALDRLIQDVRAGLGEPPAERRARAVPLPEATTPSLEALRSYAMGSAAWAAGGYRVAGELWRRALDLDTAFAMAMGALGSLGYYQHDRAAGERYYTEALRRTGRLTEWERLELTRGFASYRERWDSALAMHALMAERYPSAASWYNYGTELMSFGRPAEAIPALERALAFDSTFANIHINLATANKSLGRRAEALGHYERAGRIDSLILTRSNVGNEYAGLLIAEGRPDDAERVYRRMLTRTNLFDRVVGYRGLGFLLVWQGRLDDAVGAFRQAAGVARQQRERGRLSLMRNHLLEALSLLLIGEKAGASRALDLALTNQDASTEPGFRALLGYGLVRAGRLADAERIAAGIRASIDTLNRTDRDAAALIDAELLAARGRPDTAAALLAGAGDGRLGSLARLRRAAALAAAGRTESARLLADSGVAALAIGSEAEFEWFWNLMLSAELEARAGNPDQALARYGRLLDQWAQGDSTSALWATARGRTAELTRGR